MDRMRIGVLLGVAVLFGGRAAAGGGAITSTFDADSEGWGVLNDVQGFTWDGLIGNPAGAVRAQDIGSGNVWYFAASGAYDGDRGSAYGRTLSWDLLGITGNHTSIPNQADVMLAGAGMTVGIDVNVQPVNGAWTSWEVTIAAGGWRTVTNPVIGQLGDVVSEAQIRAVLADLTGLYLRGEYTNTAGDRMALDNVRLEIGDDACAPDLAAPFGVLNFFDVSAYLALYNAGDPAADFAAPFGALNFFDVSAFLASYNAGCP
jgi:hypothetical protein